jgi:hypothetical protein
MFDKVAILRDIKDTSILMYHDLEPLALSIEPGHGERCPLKEYVALLIRIEEACW